MNGLRKNVTIQYAVVQTVPVFFGYLVLGIAFGIMLEQAGYNVLWSVLCSVLIYAGSAQYLLVGLLQSGASVLTTASLTFLLNSRHIFYGFSFLDSFRKLGKKGVYMIFSLTDETYSVLCSMQPPDGVDRKKAMFLVALLDHLYWIFGSAVGALLGQAIPLDFTGIDFSMTALFVVIFLDQWKSYRSHLPAIIGLISSAVFLVLLGPDGFLLPSLIVTVAALMGCKRMILLQSQEVDG